MKENTCEEERERFGSIEEASSFEKELWQGEGVGIVRQYGWTR